MKTILVIEDKKIVQEAIRDWLEEEGFQTIGASNGKIGIELAYEHLPDLILCDILMPGIDGYAVLSELRKNPLTTTTPFIFLSVKGTKADVRYGMELGADDYLIKPCTAKELINAVTSRIEKQVQLKSRSQQQLESLRNSIAFSLPHEFRTPLTGILTGVELLRVIADNPREILEVANSIEECTDRLYGLVKKFLLYAELEIIALDPERIRSIQSLAAWEPTDMLRSIIKRVVTQHQRESDVQLNLERVRFFLPEDRLRRVMEELLENACKFSEVGTPIQIIGTVSESLNEDKHYLIDVINQGQGLTPDQITAVGAYVQFDRRYYEQQGSGLGLSIVQRIVELYGGRLTIASEPNAETTVRVILPAATEP